MVLSFSIFKYELVTKTKLPSILSWKNCFTNRSLMLPLCIPSNSLKPELAAFVNNLSRHLLTHPLLKHRLRTKQKATHLYFEHRKMFFTFFRGILKSLLYWQLTGSMLLKDHLLFDLLCPPNELFSSSLKMERKIVQI